MNQIVSYTDLALAFVRRKDLKRTGSPSKFMLRKAETKTTALNYIREVQQQHKKAYMLNPTGNANVVNNARLKYYLSHVIILLLSFIQIGILIIEQEIFFIHGYEKDKRYRFHLLVAGWVINLLIILNIWMSYILKLQLLKTEHLLYVTDGLIVTKQWKYLLYEVALTLICPFPYLYDWHYEDLYDGRLKNCRTYYNGTIF